MSRQYILPDLLALCPFPSGLTNPHYKAAEESSAWINSYSVFADKKRATFAQANIELLASHTYPYAGYKQFRTCCDFINFLFLIDEVSDDQSGKDARATCNVFLRALRDADWNDDSVLVKITKQFRARYFSLAGDNTSRRFLVNFGEYIEAVSKEAELREQREILSVAEYLPLRRDNSAVRLCFGLLEFVLGIDLPDKVFADDIFMSLHFTAIDMICWSNDVYSYDMEQARGLNGNNIITILCHEKKIDIQAASDYVGIHFEQLMGHFMADKGCLPSFGSALDAEVARYIDAMGQWVIGNLEWSFESKRYFGANHAEVRRTRVVTLRPKEEPEFDSDNSSEE